jgi:hypothetical protein
VEEVQEAVVDAVEAVAADAVAEEDTVTRDKVPVA